ncbi:hypothetical protein PHYSODRAFT_326967 [Phytophthora sojae]|uniref:Crinkler effector protein N-terminal domain-containing protein n=1 Tax=Phytophthora sojae (strain P6497) TaxID=1094619 RepID=G4YUV0_PHYSP|nr:hypothetical protein PHYSODRAFT_326967 [Phytophthora sojae]EGZ26025.1 hypothetical protein PHYSODRAFT_326967 [Phytophthora sojae]|eukprot:XP_009521313.1 hypothetical protein PHYSODRAFT_326967 [Phytophthora sojae]
METGRGSSSPSSADSSALPPISAAPPARLPSAKTHRPPSKQIPQGGSMNSASPGSPPASVGDELLPESDAVQTETVIEQLGYGDALSVSQQEKMQVFATSPDLELLCTLKELSIINQPTICELEGVNNCTNLENCALPSTRRLENLDALVKLEKLWTHEVDACRNRIDRIDTALNGCVNLTELNLADNRLSSFKGLLSLMNLDQLAVLVLSDPHFGDNPDTVELSARIAEATMIMKKMYYNMRVKAIKRDVHRRIRHAETTRNQAEHHIETSVSALNPPPRGKMVKLFCAIVGAAGSAFEVTIDEDASVSALKKAIKAEKPNKLKDIDAGDLQLFLAKREDGAWLKSKDLLRMRKGEIPDEVESRYMKEELDDPTDKICETFPTISDGTIHVLVVVPKQAISASIVSQDGVFDPCSDPFFAQFPTVEQVGDWLEFSSLLPLTKRQKLYIRSSYRVIADQALMNPDRTMVKYAVVTGTPGIGKSVFVYYMMWRLIKEKKRVLFFSKKGPIYFDGSTMFQCELLPNKFDQRFWSPDLWCLVDSVDPTAMTELPIEDCSVLLASTPRRDCIGEFMKLVPTPDMAQTLIHICSQEPYTEYQVAYASELAMRVIARTKLISNRANMESFLSACNGNPLAQSLCGYIFEPHCLRLLHEGGNFEYRELLTGAEMQRQRKRGRRDIDETEITIPSSSKPSQIVERFGGFQVTVGKTHDIKAGAADDLAKLGPDGNQLFFLLPPLYYKSFTKKSPTTIRQFAILVPYPEEI